MERKKTIMVLSIASVLVLAGFSINEKAYAGNAQLPNGNGLPAIPQIGLGDFYCWDTLSPEPTPGRNFDIVDQFGPVSNNDWEQKQYCAAADKVLNGIEYVSPFDGSFPTTFQGSPLDQHYQGWLYPPGFDSEPSALGTTVNLFVPQFDQRFTTTIDTYDSILVPATKIIFNPVGPDIFIDSQNVDHHWNCYGISGPPADLLTAVFTQHGNSFEQILDPFLTCAPMIKDDLCNLKMLQVSFNL